MEVATGESIAGEYCTQLRPDVLRFPPPGQAPENRHSGESGTLTLPLSLCHFSLSVTLSLSLFALRFPPCGGREPWTTECTQALGSPRSLGAAQRNRSSCTKSPLMQLPRLTALMRLLGFSSKLGQQPDVERPRLDEGRVWLRRYCGEARVGRGGIPCGGGGVASAAGGGPVEEPLLRPRERAKGLVGSLFTGSCLQSNLSMRFVPVSL